MTNKPILSWEYVAGIFDGEGSTGVYSNEGYPAPVATISNTCHKLCLILRRFLHHNNIHSRIRLVKSTRSKITSRKKCYQVIIQNHQHVQRFLELVLPYLVIKKKKARETIKAIKSKKWRSRHSKKDYSEVIKLYRQGKTFTEIEQETGFPHGAARTWARKHRIRLRSNKEARLLYLRKSSRGYKTNAEPADLNLATLDD